jgi:hypothetical protein
MRRFCGSLGLAALALQFVLSFGHLHLDGVYRVLQGTTVAASNAQAPQLPAPQPGDDGDDYCAVCATIYLASNSFVPQAPELPVPDASRSVEHFDYAVIDFIAPRRAPFQSRAPPLA